MKTRISTFLAILSLAALTACSSTPKSRYDNLPDDAPMVHSSTPANAKTLTAGLPGLKLTFTKDGGLESITSTASARVRSPNLSGSKDTAVTVATMKARGKISEFLSVKSSTKRVMDQMSKEIQAEGGDKDDSDSARIAQNLVEKIIETSENIMSGIIVQAVDVDDEQAVVTVYVDRKSMGAAAALTGK